MSLNDCLWLPVDAFKRCPITDQVGPFRADLAVVCARAPKGANGTGWPFQMYDWNVEENYFGLSRANRGSLVGSLSHGLLSTFPAMEDNAVQLANASKGSGSLLIAQGYGENMIASTLTNGSLLNATAVAAAGVTNHPSIMRGVAFSAHVIWRKHTRNPHHSLISTGVSDRVLVLSGACHASLNASCINEQVLPLLRGAISTYSLFTFTDDHHTTHLRDVGWDSSTAPVGVQQDNSWNLALIACVPEVVLPDLPGDQGMNE